MRDSFRVIALISAYNEGDVISPVIQHLVENGVEVYLLDNRSTDDTVEQASRWLGRGVLEIETFPGAEDDRYSRAAERYDWTAILLRKEELARTLEADWFLHYDADEIRESPWAGVTLKDAIRFVDSLDYNCIDFRIFDFPPVDDGFRQGMDPKTYFTHYREAGDYDQLQLKCWKARPGPVSLAALWRARRRVRRRRIFPIPFLLRHYPIRGQTHGQRKVFQERKPRFAAEERAKSWHIQYDHIQDEDYSFLVDPERLRPFDLDRARLDASIQNHNAAELKNAREAVIAGLETKLGAVEQQLETAMASLVRREAEMNAVRDSERAAIAALETVVTDLRTQVDHNSSRTSDLRIELTRCGEELSLVRASKTFLERTVDDLRADLARWREELEAARASKGALERHINDLEADVEHSREELRVVCSSRTWRWGEPVGRLIQSFGFMRRR